MNLLSFYRSTIGKKLIMAVSGIIGVAFLVLHMVGNLQIFVGPDRINNYARFLHGPAAEGVLFVMEGEVTVTLGGQSHVLTPGGYAYLPPASGWRLANAGADAARFHWIRKAYEKVDGLDVPEPLFLNEKDIAPAPMPHTQGKWATTRFVDPSDLRHDMHVTIVTLEPGAVIPFAETHVMEHGLYMLEGQGLYFLGQDWHEIWAGDFIWMGGYCPQQFYPTGFGDACYLLYKNVNRDVAL